MASPTSKHQEIERLIRLSDDSRSLLVNHAMAIRQRLDVPTRLRHSVKENPGQWLFGGLASGIATSFLFRRKASSVKKVKNRSLPLALLGITFAAVRPLLQVWLTSQAKNYITGKPIEFPRISPRSSRSHPTSSL